MVENAYRVTLAGAFTPLLRAYFGNGQTVLAGLAIVLGISSG